MNSKLSQRTNKNTDFSVFEATPGVKVLLLPDSPVFTHVAVSHDFIVSSGMQKEDVIGRGHFDLFPKSPNDPDFTGEKNLKDSFEYIIKNKLPHSIPLQRYDIPVGDGTFHHRYWKINNAPVLDDAGEIKYIVHTATDVTDQVMAEQKVEAFKGIEKVYNLFMNAPVIIGIVNGDDYVIELANEKLLEIWGRDKSVIGMPLLKAISELEGQGYIELMDSVRSSGKPYQAYEQPVTLIRYGIAEKIYLDFIYQPYFENEHDTTVKGLIIVAHDVTEKVAAREKVAEFTERLNFRNAIFEAQNEATSDGILIVDAKGNMLINNKRFAEIWKMPQDIIDAKDDAAALAHAKTQLADPEAFIEKVTELYKKAEEKSYDQVLFKDGRIIERHGTPIIGENKFYYGWAWHFRDITEQKKGEEALLQREEQLRTLVNSISQLAWIADGTGWIYWYNERWYEYTGTTLEEMQGWGWGKVHHPDHLDRVVEFVKEAWLGSEPFEITFPLRGKDGLYRWFLTRVYPLLNDAGKVVQWIGTNTDIQERIEIEEVLENKVNARTLELKSQKNLLDNILANSSNGISVSEMIRDNTGKIIDAATILANDAAIKFTGLPKDVYLNKTALELDPGILSSEYGLTCLKTLKNGEPALIQYYLEITGRWLELTLSKMDEDHLIHIFTDVTPIKEAQLMLERTVEELKRSNTNLEAFAYAASHDLKEPIRKINIFSSRIKEALRDHLGDEEKRYFERLEVSAKRMNFLIDDLLSYAQVSARPQSMDRIDLNELMQTVLDTFDLEIEEKNAKITVNKLFVITGDNRQWEQAFQNLIGNALKYKKPGIVPDIHVSYELVKGKDIKTIPDEGHEFNAITISDNGIGIEGANIDKIFNVFTRLHNNDLYQGSGVGLSIVRKVIENHKGFINVESKPGVGTKFIIYLPLEIVEKDQ